MSLEVFMSCSEIPETWKVKVKVRAFGVTDRAASTLLPLLERSLVVRPLDSFPALYGTQRFNTEFTRALHLFLS
jgi:hypothetical protein